MQFLKGFQDFDINSPEFLYFNEAVAHTAGEEEKAEVNLVPVCGLDTPGENLFL